MYTLGELFGWDEKFPVLKVTWADENRHEEELKHRFETDIIDSIKEAIRKTNQWKFTEVSEFMSGLESQLDRAFDNTWREMHHEPLYEYTIELKGNNIIISVKDPEKVYKDVIYEYDVSDKNFEKENSGVNDDFSWNDDVDIDRTDMDDIDVNDPDLMKELKKLGLSVDDFLKYNED